MPENRNLKDLFPPPPEAHSEQFSMAKGTMADVVEVKNLPLKFNTDRFERAINDDAPYSIQGVYTGVQDDALHTRMVVYFLGEIDGAEALHVVHKHLISEFANCGEQPENHPFTMVSKTFAEHKKTFRKKGPGLG